MNLISDQDKLLYSSAIDDLHNTFSRECVFYKTSERVIISSLEEFNFFYEQNQPANSGQYFEVTGVFDVRIKWKDPAEAEGFHDFPERIDQATCRLKITPEAFAFLSGVDHFIVDGHKCNMTSSKRPHGLFDIQYYTIYLTETT